MLKVAITLVCVAGSICAQDRFDTAAVKLKDAPKAALVIGYSPEGKFSVRNFPLIAIIAEAYQVSLSSGQLTGVPEWAKTERYDIDAKAAVPKGLSRTLVRKMMLPMLRRLLQEKFELSIRVDKNERAVYAIRTNENGAKLTPALITENDCAKIVDPQLQECHEFYGVQGGGSYGRAVSMADLARSVASEADRPVVDKSGIVGLFSIELPGEWSLPNMLKAMDKLGLRLVPDKAPVEAYIVEHVTRPRDN
ncbi:MAG: TIGR03435 family protein [Bryobacteraceae bacterium]